MQAQVWGWDFGVGTKDGKIGRYQQVAEGPGWLRHVSGTQAEGLHRGLAIVASLSDVLRSMPS